MARFVAHGQNWEDVRLRRVFGERAGGFFIDVGAGHPSFHSFTYTLYRQGWRGVNIEPIPAFFALIERERPEDVNLRAVLGRRAGGSATFYEVPAQRGSSTMRADVAEQLRAEGMEVLEYEVPVRTLADICEEHAGDRTIDLLKVDVEGAEAEVLGGADWERFRPRLVVVEANEPEAWETALLDHGYRFAAFDGVNNWYVERDDEPWIEVLAPPVSALDHFVPFEIVEEFRASGAPPVPPLSAPRMRDRERPRMLLVLSSSNQLYSGTGRVVFETLGRLLEELDIEVTIDAEDVRNVEVARAFCERHGLALHVGEPVRVAGAPDAGNADLGAVLRSEPWDIVMGVSWANAATHGALLGKLGDAALAYLPLHQPTWTVPLDEAGRRIVDDVHRAMLERADVVLCISPWEQHAVTELVPGVPFCAVVPPGCDFSAFTPGLAERAPHLLFVGDHREPRKRFDRVVAVLGRLKAAGVEARLVVVGNESERAAAAVPPELAPAVTSLGYVRDEELRRAYRDAAVLLLLSEYEAYGLPVIEALASGTPVVMSDQPAPRSLFSDEPAVHFVDGDDAEAVSAIVAGLLRDGATERRQLAARHGALAERVDWPVVARRTHDQLLAAWARRARRSGYLSAGSRRR